MISFRHLNIFKTVSETGSFTKAAHKLYLTQSAVSRSIHELEEQTGIILFDRLSRQVRLTAGGKLLLEEASPILNSCEALEKRLPHLKNKAPLRLVSSITIAGCRLPPVLKEFSHDWPDITVQVEVVRAADAVRILQAGDADLALAEGALLQGRFKTRVFADYPLVVVCSPDYPLSNRTLSVHAFCCEKLLLREKGSAIRDILDSRLFLLGHTVRPLWTSVNSPALIQAARAGLGITVLPEILVENNLLNGDLIRLEIKELSLKNEMYAAWHQDKYLSAPLHALLDMIAPENPPGGSP